VHGGGPEMSAYMERLGLPVEVVGGVRVSDEGTVEVAEMVLVGKGSKEIVLRINAHGPPAVCLCGDDGSLVRDARRTGPAGRDRGALASLEGGTAPKLAACVAAIDAGISAAHIPDGRKPHSLLLELFTDEATGTKIEAAG